MGYSIKSVQTPGAINTTYLYDTPEATKCDNPIRVETPEGVKYASTDLDSQKSFIKCVDEAGNIRRINSKGEDIYVKIHEKTFTPGDGEVLFPLQDNYTVLSQPYTFTIGSSDESASYPITISVETGAAFTVTHIQSRLHYGAERDPSGRDPNPGLSIRMVHNFVIYGDVNPISVLFASTEFSGGAGSGIANSISAPAGSGTCSVDGDSRCPGMGWLDCGCFNQRCSWAGCTASTIVEAGGLGMKADRCFTIPAINDPSFRAQLLSAFAYTGLTRIEDVEYHCQIIVTAPQAQMWGTMGKCTSTAGHCGAYYRGTYTTSASVSCSGGGCRSFTTNASCSCGVSEAGRSINGPDGGWNGASINLPIDGWSEETETLSFHSEIQAKVTIESIR